MARPLRIEIENAWYHVMNRGTNRCALFNRDLLPKLFLTLIQETVEMFGLEMHGYCLMGNHYHLLVKTPRANLSRVMHHIDGVYTQRYNRMENRDGPLFRGRYKAILIDAENYLVAVSRYIHRNPVEARLCASPQEYQWSSYPAYIGEAERPKWLIVDELVSYVHPEGASSYREMIENPLLPSMHHYQGDMGRSAPVLGSDEFVECALSLVKHFYQHPEIPTAPKRSAYTSLSVLIKSTADAFEKTETELLKRKRNKGDYARNTAMYLARKKYGHTLNDIAKEFRLSYSGVSAVISAFEKTIETEVSLKLLANNIMKKLANNG
jgi:putative transposase